MKDTLLSIFDTLNLPKNLTDSRSLEHLHPDFREKVLLLILKCEEKGVKIRPYCTFRGPISQAKLWRQSRSKIEIINVIEKLKREEAKTVSRILEEVGPQSGRWATNALPGQSWHNYGLAVDCYVENEIGHAVWSSKNPGYLIYADTAKELELTPGYYWKFQDSVHVQMFPETVRSYLSWKEVNEIIETLL